MPGKIRKKPTRSHRAQRNQVPEPSSTSDCWAQIGDPNQFIAILPAPYLNLPMARDPPSRAPHPHVARLSSSSHPAQNPLGPGVHQSDQEDQEEDHHLDQREGPQTGIADRPGEQEYGLDV